MGIEETVYQVINTVGVENIQNGLLAVASGAIFSACARCDYIQNMIKDLIKLNEKYKNLNISYQKKIIQEITQLQKDKKLDKILDRVIYPIMAGVGVMTTGFLTNSPVYSIASLAPFAVCSFWPKSNSAEEHSTTAERDIDTLKGNKKY